MWIKLSNNMVASLGRVSNGQNLCLQLAWWNPGDLLGQPETRGRPDLFYFIFLNKPKNIKLIYEYLASHILLYSWHPQEIFLHSSMWDIYIYSLYPHEVFLNSSIWDSHIYIYRLHIHEMFLNFFIWDNCSLYPHEIFFNFFMWDIKISYFFLIFSKLIQANLCDPGPGLLVELTP